MIFKKDFKSPLPRESLDLIDKSRTSTFPWRGQFSPELIANIYDAYCSEDDTVLDPFCGSGTVLYEAGRFNIKAIGIELNPAAYLLSKTYELINLSRDQIQSNLDSFTLYIESVLPGSNSDNSVDYIEEFKKARVEFNNVQNILLDAFIILLNIDDSEISTTKVKTTLSKINTAVKGFPSSRKQIISKLGDSRSIPLDSEVIDFVVTSPPYINVFNYHQNYRKSAEYLGWDLLKIAKSEIGSNRANRGNRFLTVIQYCIDIELTLKELHRVLKEDGRMIFVVGHKSNVLGVPFYNAQIISEIATKSGMFQLLLTQSREFKNKFGKVIREDLLHLKKLPIHNNDDVGREIAIEVLSNGLNEVEEKNRELLNKAIERCESFTGTPIYTNEEFN